MAKRDDQPLFKPRPRQVYIDVHKKPCKLRLRNRVTGEACVSIGRTLPGALQVLQWDISDVWWVCEGPATPENPHIYWYAGSERFMDVAPKEEKE